MFQRDAPIFEYYHILQYVASSGSQNSELYNKPAYYLNGISQINNRANNVNYYEKNDIDTSLLPGMTTVYVGQIPLSIADVYIRRLLNECGRIMKWNRSEDPTTKKLSSFGLCEFDSPIGVINAVKALNGLEICGKKLLVKYQHGIDALITKWNNNRISAMVKERGGDCTIETILMEISAEDTRLRSTIQKLVNIITQECSFEPDIKSNNEGTTKGSNIEISTCSNIKILSDNYKVNEKEIYRKKAFLETQKECYVICRDLDMLRYKITRDIPGCFHDKFPDLEYFLFNMLEENFEDLDHKNFDQVSLIIDMDLEKITNNKETSFYKKDDNKLCDLYDLKNSDNIDKSKKIVLDIRKLDGIQALKCDAIKCEYFQDPSDFPSNLENTDNIYDKVLKTTDKVDNCKELIDNNLYSNNFFTDALYNWEQLLENTLVDKYTCFIKNQMLIIIGDSDSEALDIIVNFILNQLRNKVGLLELFKLLSDIIDVEAEPFLKILYNKLCEDG